MPAIMKKRERRQRASKRKCQMTISPSSSLSFRTSTSALLWTIQLLFVVLIQLQQVTVVLGQHSYYFDEPPEEPEQHQQSQRQQQLQQALLPNEVKCIAHESKFICDCNNVDKELFLPHLIGSAFQLDITNCKSLTMNKGSLKDTLSLRKITFRNIENLIINENALEITSYYSNTKVIVSFEKVKIKIIASLAIMGQIEEIHFVDSFIDNIKPFAIIPNDNAVLLKMQNTQINKIESQAFKKIKIENLELENCHFLTNVPSNAFYEVDVLRTLTMTNVKFQEVHTRAFSFNMISKIIIDGNYFESVDAEWLIVKLKENSVIRNNQFGNTSQISFKGIQVHRDYIQSEPLELRFSNNTVHFPRIIYPLEFSPKLSVIIKQLNYDNIYDCKDLDMEQNPKRSKTEFFHHYKEFIYFREHSWQAEEQARRPADDDINIVEYKVLTRIIEDVCLKASYWIYILIGVSSFLIIVIIITVLVCLHLSKKRKAARKMNIIQPEPRTYKETQIVYQIENAGLLKTDL